MVKSKICVTQIVDLINAMNVDSNNNHRLLGTKFKNMLSKGNSATKSSSNSTISESSSSSELTEEWIQSFYIETPILPTVSAETNEEILDKQNKFVFS